MANTITVQRGEQLPGPDGPYAYAMVQNDGTTVLSDTRTGLLGEIIEGYADLPESTGPEVEQDPSLSARYDCAVELATMAQANYLKQAAEAGAYDLSAETNEDVYTAYRQDRNDPFLGVRPEGVDEPSFDWQHEVPLVLIPVHYAPFSGVPKPTGRIVWIDPVTETSFLDSLYEVGLIAGLAVREPSDGQTG